MLNYEVRMGIYSDAAVQAHTLITDGAEPLEAWNEAISHQTDSKASREEVCPRTTFLGLVDGGYLKNIPSRDTSRKDGVLRKRAREAAQLVLNNPGIDRKELAKQLSYNDKHGSYDILLTLSAHGLLQQPDE